MGQMGSALAHEINQPLAAIVNYLGAGRHILARSDQPPSDKIREILDKAAEQAARAGEIIRQLRSFVAKGETERRMAVFSEAAEEATPLAMVGSRPPDIRLRMERGPRARVGGNTPTP